MKESVKVPTKYEVEAVRNLVWTAGEQKRAHELFHTLWSKSVGSESYDKNLWREMEGLIYKSIMMSKCING